MVGFLHRKGRSLQYKWETQKEYLFQVTHAKSWMSFPSFFPQLGYRQKEILNRTLTTENTEYNMPGLYQEKTFTVLHSSPKIIWRKSYYFLLIRFLSAL